MAPNVGFVIVAYMITALALGGYTLSLLSRARNARRRADAIARHRRDG